MKTAFIGHRQILVDDIYDRLSKAIRYEINKGCRVFTMGTHGEFDKLALYACRCFRDTYDDLKIEVVLTDFNKIKKVTEFEPAPYKDVDTVIYDIEEAHYKQRIGLSNRQMIDSADTLICYVDPLAERSGAKTAMLYAKKQGLNVVNLYREEDNPFYEMTDEQKQEYWQKLYGDFMSK